MLITGRYIFLLLEISQDDPEPKVKLVSLYCVTLTCLPGQKWERRGFLRGVPSVT